MLSKYLVTPILDLEDLNLLLQRSSSHFGVAVGDFLDFLVCKIQNGNMAKYPLGFNRGQRQSFYIYMPKEVAFELKYFRVNIRSIFYKFNQVRLGKIPLEVNKKMYLKPSL